MHTEYAAYKEVRAIMEILAIVLALVSISCTLIAIGFSLFGIDKHLKYIAEAIRDNWHGWHK